MPKFIWPLGNSRTPDEMNTPFGPRINRNRWDFHDGVDLPAPLLTPIHSVCSGTVFRAGEGGTGGASSRHVVIQTKDSDGIDLYVFYFHLSEIAKGIEAGAKVKRGRRLGSVGDDDATYSHLHLEFRRGTNRQVGSVHPLHYLPYSDTRNFEAPTSNRFNRSADQTAVRLLFSASSKLEGDLARVDVDLMSGDAVIETRFVAFDDKETVNEGNEDELVYKNDIGVEGYQKSDMIAHQRTDLHYGILVRGLPSICDAAR